MEANSCCLKESSGPPDFFRRVRAHWLTRAPAAGAMAIAAFSIITLFLATFLYWDDVGGAQSWATAMPSAVFANHEYWRLWTALFIHGDAVHLLSNALLFGAFAYLLYGHFGAWMFPTAALFFGGLTNVVVLKTMPPETQLLGVSGVVYWMGAVWLTLYLCLESRDKFSRRVLKAMGVGAVLFAPETFRASVSYMSHFIGFSLGILWALAYYFWNRRRFLEAEEIELVPAETTGFQ